MKEIRIRKEKPKGRKFALLMVLVVSTAMLPALPAAASNEGSVTGKFGLASAPEVTAITIHELPEGEGALGTGDPATSLTPQQEYDIKVTVTELDGVGQLQNLLIKLWFDSTGNLADKAAFDAIWLQVPEQNAFISWTSATGNTTITDVSDSSWQLIDSIVPTGLQLDQTSFEFIFRFKVGKVAWETAVGEKWQIGANATKSEYLDGYMYYQVAETKGLPMNWYGGIEITPDTVINWGTIPPGINFDDPDAMKSMYSDVVVYQSNGNYNQQIKADTEWKDSVDEGIKVSLSADAAAADTFALKAYPSHLTNGDTIEHTEGVLLDSSGAFVTLKDDGTRTQESGDPFNDNRLWIKLGPSITTPTIYSGTITYGIVNRD